jgi:ZIP family zinc transporter
MLGWALAATRRTWPPQVFGLAMLASAVAMVVISGLELLPTALSSGMGTAATIAWAGLGAGLVVALRLVADRLEVGGNALARSGAIAAVAIGLHNIPEGAAPLGAAMLSWTAGVVTAIAVGLHNIPEGLAVSAPIMAAGAGRRKAFWFTAVATGGEILGALLALVFAEALTATRIGGLLALVAGVMITLSVMELGPAGARLLRHGRSTLPT